MPLAQTLFFILSSYLTVNTHSVDKVTLKVLCKVAILVYPKISSIWYKGKSKCLPQQAEVAQGFPARLRPWIFLTIGTTRVVGRQPDAPAAFTPWYSFLEAKSTPGHMVLSVATEKNPQ